MGKGTQSLLLDMGCKTADSKHGLINGKGDSLKEGLGKVRHVEVCQLWVQQEVSQCRIQMVKVNRHREPSRHNANSRG